jgi:hypothetical protein
MPKVIRRDRIYIFYGQEHVYVLDSGMQWSVVSTITT